MSSTSSTSSLAASAAPVDELSQLCKKTPVQAGVLFIGVQAASLSMTQASRFAIVAPLVSAPSM
jgi:hypothetical protein